ncbi:hypothetical protein [Streptomyces sp. MK5]|uniref:hypothetical protein n=1 Tax=Streptomyces sp. MK5 TaxID=3064253 RepID=UPI0027418109|nr:hypothetical protein [Streptomyces sp. MK5]
MIMTRSHAIATAVAAAAALTATGITYAAAVPAPQAQVAPAAVPAQALTGGEGGNSGNSGKGNEGNERRGNEHEGRRHHKEGRIQINERSFSGRPDGCIVVVSGLGSTSFNIRNESRNTVEFFRGVTCDNGAPIATVGPHSEANAVCPGKLHDEDEDENCERGEHERGEHEKGEHERGEHEKGEHGKGEHHKKHHEEMEDAVKVKNGVFGSFRVIKRHHDEKGEGGGYGGYDED